MSAYPQEIPQPVQTLVITSRVLETKYVFTPSNSTDVRYYILAPPKYKRKNKQHACGWSAIVHAGDNPKYHTLAESPVVGRCKRTMLWKKYFIEHGGSVQKDVKKEEKAIKEKNLKQLNGLRKCFCKGPKDLKWSEEEEAAISEDAEKSGATKVLELKHAGHRRYKFAMDGRTYRWSGTKMHAGSFINKLGLKGFAYHVKLIREDDHKLIASFKKCYLGRKGKFGELNFYTDERETGLEELLIVQTAFCVTKAEKEKRNRVLEILEEIGENAEG